MGEITPRKDHHLLAGGSGGLASFYIPSELDAAFRANSWEALEMIDVLCSIIRDDSVRTITRRDNSVIEEPCVTPREKMAAIVMLDRKAKEGLTLAGIIVNEKLNLKRQLEDGTVAEYDSEGMKIVEAGSSRLQRTLALLEKASDSRSDSVIDVEVVVDEQSNGELPTGSARASRRTASIRRGHGGADRGRCRSGSGSVDESDGSFDAGERQDAPTISTGPQTSGPKDNDQGTTGGAENERSTRVPE